METITSDGRTVTQVDTGFSGTCSIVAIGPGTFDTPIDTTSPQGPNVPFAAVMQPFVNGVASNHAKLTSIDVAGNYTLHAVAIVTPPNMTASAVMSNTFIVSPFSATDRLVSLLRHNGRGRPAIQRDRRGRRPVRQHRHERDERAGRADRDTR